MGLIVLRLLVFAQIVAPINACYLVTVKLIDVPIVPAICHRLRYGCAV